MKKLPVLDANIIIRFLTGDSPGQANKVEKLLSSSPKNSFSLPDLVVVEISYVLLSLYKLSKEDVIEKLEMLIAVESIKCNKALIRRSLDIFKDNSISFVDAYLCAEVLIKNNLLYTFDKRLTKVLRDKATEPK
ncbi:PIN domain-containing protein [candidate division WWE3 bacterium]|nr:PIN domain-containing protein [candidate division WWE3 bacterium]